MSTGRGQPGAVIYLTDHCLVLASTFDGASTLLVFLTDI